MKTIDQLSAEQAKRLEGVIVDADELQLGGRALGSDAVAALEHLERAGLRRVVCSARPAAWGEAIQHHWPVDMTVSENGAIAHLRRQGRVERIDRHSAGQRGRRRARLLTVVEQLRQRVPGLELADDNLGRLSDVAFRVDGEVMAEAACRAAEDLGGRTLRSPGRIHLTLDTADKASGCLYALARGFGEDESRAVMTHAFVGGGVDGGVAFAAFALTVGLGAADAALQQLTVGPRFVSASGTAGLVEIAARLGVLRG